MAMRNKIWKEAVFYSKGKANVFKGDIHFKDGQIVSHIEYLMPDSRLCIYELSGL